MVRQQLETPAKHPCLYNYRLLHTLLRSRYWPTDSPTGHADPPYFGGYVAENFELWADKLALSEGQIIQLAKNAFEGSFQTAEEKTSCLARLEGAIA